MIGSNIFITNKFSFGNLTTKLVKQFKTRVALDGGTFEAEPCFIIQLNQIEIGSYVDALNIQFKTRVLADNGTFEAESCMKTQLNQIKNIS